MLEAQINLNGPERELIFTTPSGRMWRERNFYRDVWKPAQEARRQGSTSALTSVVTAMSLICAQLASTTTTWPRLPDIALRRCWRASAPPHRDAILMQVSTFRDGNCAFNGQ
jgi:hypothetical protein